MERRKMLKGLGPAAAMAVGAFLALLPVLPDNAVQVRALSAETLLEEVRGPLTWQTITYVRGVPVHWVTETGTWKQAQYSTTRTRSHRVIVRGVFAAAGAMLGFAMALVFRHFRREA